jgi:hypothetical protein
MGSYAPNTHAASSTYKGIVDVGEFEAAFMPGTAPVPQALAGIEAQAQIYSVRRK